MKRACLHSNPLTNDSELHLSEPSYNSVLGFNRKNILIMFFNIFFFFTVSEQTLMLVICWKNKQLSVCMLSSGEHTCLFQWRKGNKPLPDIICQHLFPWRTEDQTCWDFDSRAGTIHNWLSVNSIEFFAINWDISTMVAQLKWVVPWLNITFLTKMIQKSDSSKHLWSFNKKAPVFRFCC